MTYFVWPYFETWQHKPRVCLGIQMFTDWLKIHYLGQEKSNSLHGSTQVVNIHYLGQIRNLGQNSIFVSNLETSAWQQRSIARSNSGIECKSHWSNAICLLTLNAASHVIPSVLSNWDWSTVVMYQSVLRVTSTQAISGQFLKIWQILGVATWAGPPGFPETLYFNKVYTFASLSRSQSLEYLKIRMEDIYLYWRQILIHSIFQFSYEEWSNLYIPKIRNLSESKREPPKSKKQCK